MKKILSLAAFALFATAGMAQSAKAQMKMDEGKFAEAFPIVEAEIAKVNADCKEAAAKAQEKGKPFDASKFNAKLAGLHNQAATCYAQIFNPELMKAASQAPLDTAKFVTYLDKMIEGYTKSFEYDHMPNPKGKVAAKYDKDNIRFVEGCLDYYFYSAIFCNTNGDKEGASKYFQKHLALPSNPVLASKKDSILVAKKDNYEQTAYFSTILNYEQKKWDEILKSVDAGLKNKEYAHDLYLIKAEAVLETTKDTAQYIAVLKDAVMNVEKSSGFSESLLSIYYQREDADGALATANDLVAARPNEKAPWYMKGCVLLNLKREYKAARECFEKVLAMDPEDLLGNANMSYAWTNDIASRRYSGEFKYIDKSSVTAKEKPAYDKELEEIRSYYSAARPYMEKVRELAPDRSKVWAPALQQIYANLGMKAEADQMDEIMSNN